MRENLKKVYIRIIKIFVSLLNLISRLYSKDNQSDLNSTMRYICEAVETDQEFVAFQIKPKNTADIPILEGLNKSQSLAIVLQGPLCAKDDMTRRTILFYRKTYPYAKIIVSTWNDEPKDELDQLVALDAIIVTSEKPKNSGIMNVNFQLTNSLAGVKKAKEIGCEFTVKTRTDQRICKPYIFDTMISTIKMFPGLGNQGGRIVALGVCGGGMFIPYYICDFLYLGYTDDIIKLFSAPFDKRNSNEIPFFKSGSFTRRENAERMYSPEIYILKHYCINALGLNGMETVEAYWQVVKNNFILFGMKDVDLFWNKYTYLHDLNYYSSAYEGEKDSAERLQTMCFDFFNWLNLYTGNFKYDRSYEKYDEVTLSVK